MMAAQSTLVGRERPERGCVTSVSIYPPVRHLFAPDRPESAEAFVDFIGVSPKGARYKFPPDGSSLFWRRLVKRLQLPKVTLHGWRHTHASALIASGMDVLTISRRLGHASPSITLDVYSHLFRPTDEAAAAAFETAFGKALSNENKSTGPGQSENQIGGKLAANDIVLRLPPPSSI